MCRVSRGKKMLSCAAAYRCAHVKLARHGQRLLLHLAIPVFHSCGWRRRALERLHGASGSRRSSTSSCSRSTPASRVSFAFRSLLPLSLDLFVRMRLVAHGSGDSLGDKLRLVHVGQQLRVRLVVVEQFSALILQTHAHGHVPSHQCIRVNEHMHTRKLCACKRKHTNVCR